MENNREISFVIEKRLGVLSQSGNGWKKELNLVSWNGKPAKLDIREWAPDHKHMSKGLTLRREEAWLLQRNLYRWLTGNGKPEETAAPVGNTAGTETATAVEEPPFDDGEAMDAEMAAVAAAFESQCEESGETEDL